MAALPNLGEWKLDGDGTSEQCFQDKLQALTMGKAWGWNRVDSHTGQHGPTGRDWDTQAGSTRDAAFFTRCPDFWVRVKWWGGVSDHPMLTSLRSSPSSAVKMLCDSG